MSDEYGYIVAANMAYQEDDELGKKFNIQSGLSDMAFHHLFRDSAQRHGARMVLAEGNTVIMFGNGAAFKNIVQENGARFSYAFTDERSVMDIIDAMADSKIIQKILEDAHLPRNEIQSVEIPLHS